MSGLRSRLARALASASGRLTPPLDEVDERARADRERQDALTRDAVADLTERLAAIERRLAALEARDQ